MARVLKIPPVAGILFAGLMAVLSAASGAHAQEPALDRQGFVAGLCGGGGAMGGAFETGLGRLGAASADDIVWLGSTLDALSSRRLRCDGDAASIAGEAGASDAATGRALAGETTGRAPVVNLRARAGLENLTAALALVGEGDGPARQQALSVLSRRPESVPPAVYARAAEQAASAPERAAIEELSVFSAISSDDGAARIAAVEGLAARPNRRTLLRLEELRDGEVYAADPQFRAAVDGAISSSTTWVQVSTVLSTAYNGVSYASILFIAAVGLAIIFGLMGIINLAQGEFIMLGAYTAFLVQETLRGLAPALVDWYLVIAIPFVFVVTAALGILVEATILRHLYRRPLMTLLATWAVSLFLINIVRVTFGTQNLQFLTPPYVTGGFTLVGDFIVTYNRLFAIVFAALVLAATWFTLKRTALGLNIRTVTQNRDMAGCIGIATRRVDMMAFGLGSGLAGLAGLALAPIYNVNPLMGTNFIIESFMVVVLGGVGTLAGTLIASLGIGQINVLIEPAYGAVAAKVIVLLLIILFIQWRPEGLFPAPGRRK